MKYLHVAALVCLSLCALFTLSQGAGEICEANGLSIPVGQTKEKNCVLYECVMQRNRLVLDTFSCANLKKERGCKSVPGDPKLAFPKCCPTSRCRGAQWDQ